MLDALPLALKRGYPQPVTVHEPAAMSQPGWDPRGKVYSTVWADRPWELAWKQADPTYSAIGSPVAGKDGEVFFADPPANRIYRVDAAGKVSVFRENTAGASALAVGPDGRVYASQPARKRIVAYGAAAGEAVVAHDVEAAALAITAQGALYFSNPSRGFVGLIGPRRAQPPRGLPGHDVAAPTRPGPVPRPGHAGRHRRRLAL